jgi:hypothetical protein
MYEMCREQEHVYMHHDHFVVDVTALGHAPSRALTQVYHQNRTEFLLVYKCSTVIHVPL